MRVVIENKSGYILTTATPADPAHPPLRWAVSVENADAVINALKQAKASGPGASIELEFPDPEGTWEKVITSALAVG